MVILVKIRTFANTIKIKMENPDVNYEFYKKNIDSLISKYPQRFVVISDKQVVADGASFEDALTKAIGMGLTLGSFLIQQCTPIDSQVQYFSSRAVFA